MSEDFLILVKLSVICETKYVNILALEALIKLDSVKKAQQLFEAMKQVSLCISNMWQEILMSRRLK